MVDAKAWRDIWTAGQGVTSLEKSESTKKLVETLREEYNAAIEEFLSKQTEKLNG